MTREMQTTKTGMTTTKIEIGSTTGEDPTNTNTTETNQRNKSFSNTHIRTYWK